MRFKATVLCENTVFGNGPIAEHGWSVFLETDAGNFLFDTGQGKAIIHNANYFKKDLSSIEAIMLSHHHGDHTGGLLDVLDYTGEKVVYAHSDIFRDAYNTRYRRMSYAGIPYRREVLEGKGAQFDLSRDFRQIAPGLYLTGEIPRITPYEKGDAYLVIKDNDQLRSDPVIDDQSLIIETEDGLFIILGCCHAGIINTLKHAVHVTGQKRIHTVIGGTHLGPVSNEQREESIKALKEFNIERLGVSHCTGMKACMRLYQEFGEKFFFYNVGAIVDNENVYVSVFASNTK